MATHRFETVLQAEDGGVFFEVPLDVPAVFGKARAPVRGTINGHPFRSTVAVYGGRSFLPVKKALREAAGVAAGDAVVIELEADEQPRTIDPPPDLAAGSTRPSRCSATAAATPRGGATRAGAWPALIVPRAGRYG